MEKIVIFCTNMIIFTKNYALPNILQKYARIRNLAFGRFYYRKHNAFFFTLEFRCIYTNLPSRLELLK